MVQIPKVALTFEMDGREQRREFQKACITLGRSPGCDLVVREEKISRRHAVVLLEGHRWVVVDEQSANGTKVNDANAPIMKCELNDGDVIWLGDTPVRFEVLRQSLLTESQNRVVFDDGQSRKNKTAIFNMADLGSKVAEFDRTNSSKAAGWAISLFSEAAQAMLSTDSLDAMFEKMLDIVFKNLPADRGVVALLDETRQNIVPRASRTRFSRPSGTEIHLSRSIAMEAVTKKQAFRVGEPQQDSRFVSEESIVSMNISSAMCAPMFAPGSTSQDVVGILYCDFMQKSMKPFSEDDLQLLSALAAFSAVAVEQRRLHDEIRYQEDCRSRLAKYNSPQIVERVLADAKRRAESRGQTGLLDISGMLAEEREVTVLFADLSGFTSMAEKISAADTAGILNEIFAVLTECIFEHEGTLDKFMGDAVMAFFGAPVAQTDHAERAVNAALDMQERLGKLNERREEGEVKMRIGLNSGPVVAGDIGSPERKDYTVIGDVVNVASRLESTVAKPGQVVIGPATEEAVRELFTCTAVEAMALKGKTQKVQPFLVTRREA